MSLKSAIPLAFAALCLPLATTCFAVTYTEPGDAGDLPATAAVVAGAPNTTLDSISGTLTITTGVSETDMFLIYISNPATFSATTVGPFTPGVNTFDTQLFLLTSTGVGKIANDDNPSNGAQQSTLPAGSLNTLAGMYYLAVSGSGRYAISGGGVIFPNFTDGTTDPTAVVGPTGPGGATAITGYTGSSNEGGAYKITLTGAQFVAVPEPGVLTSTLLGVAGLAFLMRVRRSHAKHAA